MKMFFETSEWTPQVLSSAPKTKNFENWRLHLSSTFLSSELFCEEEATRAHSSFFQKNISHFLNVGKVYMFSKMSE